MNKIVLRIKEGQTEELKLYSLEELNESLSSAIFSNKRRIGLYSNGKYYYAPLSHVYEPPYKGSLRTRIFSSNLKWVKTKGDKYEVLLKPDLTCSVNQVLTFNIEVLKNDVLYPLISQHYEISDNENFNNLTTKQFSGISGTITNIIEDKTYYLRIKTVNLVGTFYSNVLKFKVNFLLGWTNSTDWRYNRNSPGYGMAYDDPVKKLNVVWNDSLVYKGSNSSSVIVGRYKYYKGEYMGTVKYILGKVYYYKVRREEWAINRSEITYL